MSHYLYVQSFFALGDRISIDLKLRKPFQKEALYFETASFSLEKDKGSGWSTIPWDKTIEAGIAYLREILAICENSEQKLHPKAMKEITNFLHNDERGLWEYDVERNCAFMEVLSALTVWY